MSDTPAHTSTGSPAHISTGPLERRYDIDWLRVIAIFLLLIYHAGISFQPWAREIAAFIQSDALLESLWTPMSMLNVWRIPLIFFVSGMGLYFSVRQRNWKQVLGERAQRILVPFLFGVFTVVPLFIMVFYAYYKNPIVYIPHAGHLWFLGNIFVYIVVLLPIVFFIKKRPDNRVFKVLRQLLSKFPPAVYIFVIPMLIEAALLPPSPETYYATYALTIHGFFLGLIMFFMGFFFIALGDPLRQALKRMKVPCLLIALALFLVRYRLFWLSGPHVLTAIESASWIFGILGLADTFLNRPSPALSYLNGAVYPVYVIHMVMLYLGAYFIFPLNIPGWLQFVLVTAISIMGSFLFYEIVKRIPILRPLFGLRWKKKQ